MKRRVISTITALALCLSLCPTGAMAADMEPDTGLCSHHRAHTEECGYIPPAPEQDAGAPCAFTCRLCPIEELIDQLPDRVTPDNRDQAEEQLKAILALYTGLTAEEQDQLNLSRCFDLQSQLDEANIPALAADPVMRLPKDSVVPTPLDVEIAMGFDTGEYSYTATKTSAVRVLAPGKLSLMGSLVVSQNGAGVEVQAGGSLSVGDAGLTVIGTTYGLDVASGGVVELSGGTFTGEIAAIRTENNDFAALLKDGYAYYDTADNPILPADVATAKTVVIKVAKDLPVIQWGSNIPVPVEVNYDGSPVEPTDLPEVIVTINGTTADLSQYLQYSYKATGVDAPYTDGLPTNAGTYDVIVRIPDALEYYQAASSASITLMIHKINPVKTPPAALTPIYNRTVQALVSAGVVWDGAVVEFAQKAGGPYSTDVPTGVDADVYPVWYRVTGNENYDDVPETKIPGVLIQRKEITPKIELSETSFVYDGSKQEPVITVKDGEIVLDPGQYRVVWDKNQIDVGVHRLTIQDEVKANYTFTGNTTASIDIVPAVQNGLKITGKPSKVYYGDTIVTLDTVGGSGNGSVKWTLSGGTSSAIDEKTGVLTIREMGTFTVKAERTVDNYGPIEDTWTFTVEPKPVMAEVTVGPKVYDGGNSIAPSAITALVNAGDLVNSSDRITITGLTGVYDDGNAGTNKPVTLNSSAAQVSGADQGKYSVSYPAAAVADITPKPVDVTVTLSDDDLKTDPADSSKYYFDYDGTAKTPAVTVTEQNSGAPIPPAGNYTVSYRNNKNAGTASVIVESSAGGNYTFKIGPVTVNFTIRETKAVLTTSPVARDLTYTGAELDLVTVGAAAGGTVVYSLAEAGPYKETVPQKKEAGTYIVYYKVEADANHQGSTNIWSVPATIKPKEIISPIVTVSPDRFTYTGSAQTPTAVTVVDNGTTIPDSEYTVEYSDNIDAGTATVHIINKNGGNYIVNGSASFEIAKGKACFAQAPQGKTGLVYQGAAQPLVDAGTPQGGRAVYSVNGGDYSAALPTGIDVGSYSIRAMVKGDKNHEDSDSINLSPVSIGVNAVANPSVSLSSSSFQYNGSEQKPVITVLDGAGNEIPANEYNVTYSGSTVNAGTYTVTIEGKGTRYHFGPVTRQVTILAADQTALTITGKPNVVYYGSTIQLGTTGGTGSGTVTWTVVSGSARLGSSDGQFEITGTGTIEIKATRTPAAGSSYAPVEDVWSFYAYPKPVTADVKAQDKVYDASDAAVVTVTVPGTKIKIEQVTGTFDSADVGSNKTVAINYGTMTVTGDTANYNITYPQTATASITPAKAAVDSVTWASALTYTGRPQKLVDSCSVTGGTAAYSLNGIDYDLNVPTATDARTYRVWCKVLGGGNYTDSEPVSQDVTIGANQVSSPRVECAPGRIAYDGTAKTPNVTVLDDTGRAISKEEYDVAFDSNDRIEVGHYKVTVTAKPGSNYEFSSPAAGSFDIVPASQNPLSIVTSKPANVCYGDSFKLSTLGGSGVGDVQWSITGTAAQITQDGWVTVVGVGSFTVKAYKDSDSSYLESNTDSVSFFADPKPITLIVTAADKNYNGNTAVALSADWESGGLVGTDKIGFTVKGEFLTPDAGTSKPVKVEAEFSGNDDGKYAIICSSSTTASIYKAEAKLTDWPIAATGLVYSGSELTLLTRGAATENGIGVVEYMLDGTGGYSPTIPGATEAGVYTVWYKVVGSGNYTGIAPASITVTIAQKPTKITVPPTITGSLTYGQPLNKLTLNGGDAEGVPGSFAWADGSITPDVGESTQTVVFTPTDTVNYASSTATIQVTVAAAPDDGSNPGGSGTGGSGADGSGADGSGADGSDSDGSGAGGSDASGSGTGGSDTSGSGSGGSGANGSGGSGATTSSTPAASAPNAVSTPMQTSVQNGVSKTVVNTAGGDKLVSEAAANQSEAVVIKPEITGAVTKTEVSIPASTVSRIQNETNANLTVSTPVADVTIPNAALNTLSSGGGAVSVVTERTENTVALTLTAGGKNVESIPGGVTLTVPVEEAGPGTVAVVVHDDGTRETIRKAVPENGELSVPLNGSATVEIVDNSKEFTDVPATDWAADAVAFASAHELFNGTSETTFSPNQPMSRAMLTMVLYNLEGRPAQSLTDEFSDVDSGAWYAESVTWATENNITNGYDGEQFGPDDSVTREQFAVMLWRYAGSPAASGRALSFVDAEQASSYAMEALCWAAENGILNGHNDGRLDPGGLATRAQAAQMLKNFMENT